MCRSGTSRTGCPCTTSCRARSAWSRRPCPCCTSPPCDTAAGAGQVTGLLPVQTPLWQVSVCVQALPSLHDVPLPALVCAEHCPSTDCTSPRPCTSPPPGTSPGCFRCRCRSGSCRSACRRCCRCTTSRCPRWSAPSTAPSTDCTSPRPCTSPPPGTSPDWRRRTRPTGRCRSACRRCRRHSPSHWWRLSASGTSPSEGLQVPATLQVGAVHVIVAPGTHVPALAAVAHRAAVAVAAARSVGDGRAGPGRHRAGGAAAARRARVLPHAVRVAHLRLQAVALLGAHGARGAGAGVADVRAGGARVLPHAVRVAHLRLQIHAAFHARRAASRAGARGVDAHERAGGAGVRPGATGGVARLGLQPVALLRLRGADAATAGRAACTASATPTASATGEFRPRHRPSRPRRQPFRPRRQPSRPRRQPFRPRQLRRRSFLLHRRLPPPRLPDPRRRPTRRHRPVHRRRLDDRSFRRQRLRRRRASNAATSSRGRSRR